MPSTAMRRHWVRYNIWIPRLPTGCHDSIEPANRRERTGGTSLLHGPPRGGALWFYLSVLFVISCSKLLQEKTEEMEKRQRSLNHKERKEHRDKRTGSHF